MNNVEVTKAVVCVLEECQVDYMLVGAYSSNAYGIARATHDVDFVVVVKPGEVRAIAQRLGPDFVLDPQIMMEGKMDVGAWSCGMVAGLIHDVPTCKELIDRIMTEAESLITQRLARFAGN